MFEPFFDQYLPSVTFNGGKPVYVPLHPPKDSTKNQKSSDWTIDIQELRYVILCQGISTYLTVWLRRAITPRTKMIILNTPHNPVGKVFTKTELEAIAAIAEEFNLLVMADEVVCQSFLHNQNPLYLSSTSTTVWYLMG